MKRQNITADNNSEFELLLACIQDDNNPEQNHKIRSLCRKDIDWSELIQKALAHGVIPFVYHRLCAACPDSVPESVLTKIRNHYQVNARHSFLLARELIKILNLYPPARA